MGICLYNNGIVEEVKPIQLTFTEEELTKPFGNYKSIRSKRLTEIPNVWCIWGEMENPDPIEFNRLCTDMLEVYIFSHVLFIHDSEIDPSWELNDMLYKSYEEFKTDLKIFVDEIAQKIMTEQSQMPQGTSNMIYLSAAGQTEDKHVIYMFNPTEQSDDFYKDGSFSNFSDKIIEYLKTNLKLNEHLTIFADKKIIIEVSKDNVPTLFNKMLKNFEIKEKYEICAEISNIHNKWTDFVQKRKRGRPKKDIENKETSTNG